MTQPAKTPELPHLAMTPITRLLSWISRGLHAQEEFRWLQSQEPAMIAAMARDIGLSVQDFEEAVMTDPASIERVARMKAEFGLGNPDIEAYSPSTEIDLVRLCGQCAEKSRCEGELAAGSARMHAHEFCLNASAFEEAAWRKAEAPFAAQKAAP